MGDRLSLGLHVCRGWAEEVSTSSALLLATEDALQPSEGGVNVAADISGGVADVADLPLDLGPGASDLRELVEETPDQ